MPLSRYFENEAIESLLRGARLIVFDLNGLILDDEQLQINAVNAVFRRSGLRFDERTRALNSITFAVMTVFASGISMNALAKLERGADAIPMDVSPAAAHMFIVNPLSGRSFATLFSTHPPISERIERLRHIQ